MKQYKRLTKAASVAALAVVSTGIAANSYAVSNGLAYGDVHKGIYCHGNNPNCTPAASPVYKGVDHNTTAVVDVSHQQHDRGFNVGLSYYDKYGHQQYTTFWITANEGVKTLTSYYIPKGVNVKIEVVGASNAPLDANSSIYIKLNP